MFIGVLGMSQGSHYEFGLARAFGKPALLIEVAELPTSYIAQGLSTLSKSLLRVHVESFEEVRGALTQPRVENFLRRYFPIRRK